MTVSVKSEPREDVRERSERNTEASIRVRSPRGHRRPGADRGGPILPLLLNRLLTGPERKIKSPLQAKSLLRRGFASLSENFETERGEGFLLCVVVYDNV